MQSDDKDLVLHLQEIKMKCEEIKKANKLINRLNINIE